MRGVRGGEGERAVGLKLQLGRSGGFPNGTGRGFSRSPTDSKVGNLNLVVVPVNLCPSPSIGPAHKKGTLNFVLLHGLNRPVSKGNRFPSYARVYANFGPIVPEWSDHPVLSPASMNLVSPNPGFAKSNLQISSPKRFCFNPGNNTMSCRPILQLPISMLILWPACSRSGLSFDLFLIL